jgi:CHAT domain-containing protein/Tfp pilus assembly protein PilF
MSSKKLGLRAQYFVVVLLFFWSCRVSPVQQGLEETPELSRLHRLANDQLDAGSIRAAEETDEAGYRVALRSAKPGLAARFLTNCGALAMAQARYRSAHQMLLRSRQLSEKASDLPGEALALANLTTLYIQTGDFDAAKLAAEQGIECARIQEPYPGMRAQLLINLGTTLAKLNQTGKAEESFARAIDAAAQSGPLSIEGNAWDALGFARLKQGDLEGAEPALVNAYRLRLFGDKATLAGSLAHLSELQERKGNFEAARTFIDNSLAGGGGSISAWYLRFQQARIMAKQGDSQKAIEGYRGAVRMASAWREDMAPTDAVRSGAFNWLGELYEQYVDELIEGPGFNLPGSRSAIEAFVAVEEQRSSALRRTLLDSSSARQNMPDEYWQTLSQLRSSETMIASRTTPEREEAALALRKKLDQLEDRQLTETSPRKTPGILNFSTNVSQLDTNTSPVREKFYPENTLRNIQRRLGTGELLLSFHFGPRASCVWACTRNSFEVHVLPSREQVQKDARAFGDAVASASPDVPRLGRGLFDELFGLITSRLRAYEEWTLTVEPTIARIPLVALRERPRGMREAYLIERHSVHFVPTAMMRNAASRQRLSGGFLGFGDGVYNRADPRWSGEEKPSGVLLRAETSRELPRLVGTRRELDACARSWGGETRVFTGFSLTRETLLKEVERHPAVIHLAAHVLEAGRPEEALIDLGLKKDGTPEVLTRYDVANLRLTDGVVVMSGCGSAAAPAPEGTGLLGLARAWLISGATSVVGSRWSTADDTGALFKRFYVELRVEDSGGEAPVAKALRRAELEMLRSGTWRARPQYWASFYEIGKE